MKIAVVLPENEPFSNQGGAFAIKTYEIFERFPESIDVFVYSRSKNDEIYPCLKIKHKTLFSGNLIRMRFLWRLFKIFYFFEMVTRVSLGNYGKIIIMNCPKYIFWFSFFNRSKEIILYLGNPIFMQINKNLAQRALEKFSKIICVSDYVLNQIVDAYPHLKIKLYKIYNGVDSNRFSQRGLIFDKKVLTFLFVGRLIREKGVHLLIEAFCNLSKMFPQIKLILVGSDWFGSNRRSEYVLGLERMAMGNDNINFVGFVPHDQIHKFHQDADIFVAPSTFEEASGSMNLEAMASGLAVISTLRGGIPEIVGDAGILVQPSTKEIQDAMLKLLANKELRADFGIRARKRAQERFSWDETSKMLVDVLRSTL